MARYRKIETRIWNDAKFRALSERGKLVWFFLLSHPYMTMLGAMRGTLPGLSAELSIDAEAFTEAFREVLAKGMAKYDERASFVWLPNFLRYNRPESPNVVRAWPEAFELLPECRLKVELSKQIKGFTEGLPEGFQEAFRQTWPNQEPEPEPEPEPDKRETPPASQAVSSLVPKKKRIAKTSLPENFGISDHVRQWAAEKGHAQLEERLESFCLSAKKQNYLYSDWDAAFQSAIRDDWAKLNQKGVNGNGKLNKAEQFTADNLRTLETVCPLDR